MQTIDLLIEAGWVVPVEPHGVALRDHALAVDAGRIVALLPAAEARAAYAPRERVERPHHVLLPGLINAHTHSPMALMRGFADDLPLMTWLREHIWPAEGQVMSPDFVRDGTELAVAEMIRGGTTACNELYFFPDVIAATCARLGFRALVGSPIIQFPSAWARTEAEYLEKAVHVHGEYRDHPLVRIGLAPHAPYTVSDAALARLHRLSEELDLPVHMHVHENHEEIEECLRNDGVRPLERLHRLGILGPRFIAVHMTQLTDAEIALCARAGLSVAHCPESNLKLASGLCPVHRLLAAGVNVAIGTDGCASNNDLDMLGELRTASLLAKGVAGDASAVDAATALRMATLDGARAMRIEGRVGSLGPGKEADVVALRLDEIEALPFYSVLSHLVYAASRRQVTDVWIAGARRLADGALVGWDMGDLRARAGRWSAQLAALRRA